MSLFARYATSSAFRVELTQPMAHALHVIDAYERDPRSNVAHDHFNMREEFGYLTDPFTHATRALMRRGLIEWHEPPKLPNGRTDWSQKTWRMTDAGKHVLALCRLADIVPQATNVVPISAAKKRKAVRR